MHRETPKSFDLHAGFAGIRARGEINTVYLAIVCGLVLHWMWEVLVAAVRSGHFDFGSWTVVVARLSLASIVGLVSFAGIWKQLERVDPTIRFFVAVTQGFAMDALAAPVVGL
jgi:hypothetical protein